MKPLPKPDQREEELEERLLEQTGKFQRLLESYNKLLEERNELDDEHTSVLNSVSWRVTAPLRRVARWIRMCRPLLRFGGTSLTVESFEGIELVNDRYKIVGVTPYIVLKPSGTLNNGWALFRCIVTGPLYIALSFGDETGFSEQNKKLIPLSPEQPYSTVRIPKDATRIRIDPYDTGEPFGLHSFSISELGKLQLSYYLIRNKLGPSPALWMAKLKKGVQVLKRYGIGGVRARLLGEELSNDYQDWVRRYDTLTDEDRSLILKHSKSLTKRPLISVILPVYNTPEQFLRLAIDSVCSQIYDRWELCIADDASTEPHVRRVLEEYRSKDPRIKIIYRDENGHISEASNSALSLATGDYVALLDHDDELREHALYMVAVELNAHPSAKIIYSDEDKKTEEGLRFNPYFKSDWNPELFLQQNFICHLTVFERSIVQQVGGFRKGFEGSQDWDLTLRVIEEISEYEIRHIPHILYHWRATRGSTAQASSFKPYALEAGKRAVEEHLKRRRIDATVEVLPAIAHYRVVYALPEVLPLVSIIIPTRDRCPILARCIESIQRLAPYPNFEIIVVDNGSKEKDSLEYLKALNAAQNITVFRDESPFNFSSLNNKAARMAKGEILGFLNNDLEVLSPNWLSEMVSHLLQDKVGAVGARLWYPNYQLQHGGVILGIGGVAGHNHKGFDNGDVGYFNRAVLVQNLSAVTAACMLVRRDVFESIGGFNEKDLSIAFNDVDLCIRIRKAGWKIVWTPYAELYHYESVSRGYEHTPEKFARFEREVETMKRLWGETLAVDPYYNPNLSIFSEDFRIAFPPRVSYPWRTST